jgi:NAD-dependent DNA ligase
MPLNVLDFMAELSREYYNGTPLISNEEYDALEKKYGQLLEGVGEVPHFHRMYSLQKHYDRLGEPPLPIHLCIKTPKLDGAAVSLLYVNSKFVQALTRGDGKKGRDITDKMRLLVPQKIPSRKPTQITGEVVAITSVENSRNFASGALNLKSLEEFKSRIEEGKMIFVAYATSDMEDTYTADLHKLKTYGFLNPADWVVDVEKYPTDGLVYRLNDNKEYARMGYTEKFPRGAFAWKQEQESVETTLLDVVWQTGKSGKVTPVAILEPVIVSEASVSRATLNNIAYIEALDLEIGCRVKLIRSGEIIPKIIERVWD